MQAKSIRGNSAGEIQSALTTSMADGFMPTLAFVFLSTKKPGVNKMAALNLNSFTFHPLRSI